MKHEIKLDEAPDLLCPRCGEVIPAYIHYSVVDGIISYTGQNRLICEGCARAAMPPAAPVKRLRRGEGGEGQLRLPGCEESPTEAGKWQE